MSEKTNMRARPFACGASVALADMCCPGNQLFGERRAAERMVGKQELERQSLTGKGVNVVVIDQGVDARVLGRAVDGWRNDKTGRMPGTADRGHGTMVARTILGIAPDVTIFDCPLFPPTPPGSDTRIADVEVFLRDAVPLFETLVAEVTRRRSERWVFANAWYIPDRRTERADGHYTNGPDHRLNRLIDEAVDAGTDVLFCAGNCGQFCPSAKCGPGDRGPGSSILGANSHPKVLTVGAVRVDGTWLGYSAQGPGQPRLDPRKPDLCAPTQFSDAGDAHASYTGTSAAMAVATGVVAALRSSARLRDLPPADLKSLLLGSARRSPGDPTWSPRLGHGILDAAAALRAAG